MPFLLRGVGEGPGARSLAAEETAVGTEGLDSEGADRPYEANAFRSDVKRTWKV